MARLNEEKTRRQETAKNSKKAEKRTESKENRMSAWNACRKKRETNLADVRSSESHLCRWW